MTPQAQRIAIAKACPAAWFNTSTNKPYWKADYDKRCPLFDPLSDLNAMHEAEKTLDSEQIVDYVNFLGATFSSDEGVIYRAVHTTAAQRAEPFLRAKGLWK